MEYLLILIIFLIGLIFGSFFNVCIYRIPRNESLLFPSSHCPSCNHPLAPLDLVPVFSYLFLRGKCRYCREPISWKYPFIELLTGLLFISIYMKAGITWHFLFYLLLASLLLIAALIDLKHRIIPNSLVLFGVIAALLFNAIGVGQPFLDGLLGFLLGGGTLLLVAFLSVLILRKEGMGGGDVKFMAMIGLFLGWKMTLMALLLSIYIGGFFAIVLLVFRLTKMKDAIPYGPFISLGTLITLFWGKDILLWYIRSFLS